MDELAKPRVEAPVAESTSARSASPPVAKDASTMKEGELYATYELDHHKPYLADHFEIGDLWNNPDLSYRDEIKQIDSYLQSEIKEATLNNTTKAVSERLKQLEKMAGIDTKASPALRVQQLAAFAKYLSQLSDIRLKVRLDERP